MLANPPCPPRNLAGLSFEIPDLLLAQGFAASCGFRMAVETHHHVEHDEFEEVIALYLGQSCRWLIWRSAAAVVLQPMLGRARQFASVSDALEWLGPEEPVLLDDLLLQAEIWAPPTAASGQD